MNGTKAEDIKFVSRWWMFTNTGAEDKAQKEMDSLRKRIAEHFPKEKDAAS